MFKFNEVFTKRQDFATSGKKINKNNSSTIGDIFNIIFGSKKVNLEIPKLKDEKKLNASGTSAVTSANSASSKTKKESKLDKTEKSKRIKQSRVRKLSNSSVSKLTTDKDAVNEINAMFQEFIRHSKKEVRKPFYPHESYLDDEILSEGQLKYRL